MRLAATAFVLVAMVSMAVSAPLRNTVDVTIIRSEQDELEATVEWENGRMGMRIEAKQNKLLIRSMAADEEIFIYGEKKDSGTFYTAGGQSFFTMETEQNDGTVTKMDYVIPDSMKEQAKEAFEQKKMDRILSTLDHENAQQYTEQTIQSLIHRPEVTVLEQAARVLGEGGLIGRNNKGALLFYMTILNMVKSQDREMNQHSYVAKREVKSNETIPTWEPIPPEPCTRIYITVDLWFFTIRICIRVCTICYGTICRNINTTIESTDVFYPPPTSLLNSTLNSTLTIDIPECISTPISILDTTITHCPINQSSYFESFYTHDYWPYSSDQCAIAIPDHLHMCRKNNWWWILCADCYHGYECELWFCPIEDPCPPGGNCDHECIGMCGRLCWCWPWLCGDCCYWYGCYQHDRSCGESFLSFPCLLPFNFACNGY